MYKIAINYKLQDGPYGGGNAFVKNLLGALNVNKCVVNFDLKTPDLDFILMIDPRSRSPNITFSVREILDYLKENPRTLVIHRINECDERKKTLTMNFRLRLANYCADYTVYVGSWLRKLNLINKNNKNSTAVILNGANENIFKPQSKYNYWSKGTPLKIVTHHWGGNLMKGFDVYGKLDRMLEEPFWKEKISFTYIGNLPNNYTFKNANYISPLHGKKLAEELQKHHVYISASKNEPGGNHQIEGILCGLPILFRDSGCLPEYCEGFGLIFKNNEIEQPIIRMIEKYSNIKNVITKYPLNSTKTNQEWINLFNKLNLKRNNLFKKRNLRKSNLLAFLNRINYF